MTYALGIDLGTTYTAAAVARNGRAEVAALGYRATSVPTVVLLTEDGRFLVGDAAERRAANEPNRVAREFKRRMGDHTPLLLGGTPIAVDRCLAEVLRWVTKTVGETEGGPPGSVTVTHPANWGEFKQDVLREALRLADLPQSRLLAEPVAAATWYAQAERLPPGHVVAVYDLGGGTFDTAILRQGADGKFENLGRAEGIERLGGIDIDQAVFGHVLRALGDDGARLDSDADDPGTVAAIAQLRRACVEAKEALSSETSVTIPVWLPGLHHEVLMHRTELEELVGPLLGSTVEALGRVVRSTGLRAADVHSVLLVGGSSRIPLIARQVSAGFGRPVAVDAHPKHPVALGAALDALTNLAAAPVAKEPWVSAPAPASPPQPRPQPSWSPTGPPTPPPPPRGSWPQNDARKAFAVSGIATVVILLAALAFMLLQPNDDDPETNATSNDNPSEQTEDPGTSPDSTAAVEGEPESEPEAPSDLIHEVASAPFESFAGINDGAPVRVVDITIHPDWAKISVQKADTPGYADEYEWDGGLTGPEPMFIPPEPDEIEAELFDLTEVDPAVIPGLAQDVMTHCPWEGGYVTHVIIDRETTFDDQQRVLIRVYVGQEPDYGESGYVSYATDGTFVESACD